MGINRVQTSFVGGELAPSMYGRFDDKKYQQGLAKCRNFIPLPQGPVTFRPGTAYVNTAKYSHKKARLLPFTFDVEQTMVLELGDRYIRFHTRGKTLLGGNGQPYEVHTPYAEEDLANIHYTQSMDVMTLVHPNYPPKELRRYGPTDWRLTDVAFGAPLPAPNAPSVSFTVVAGEGVTITEAEKTRYTLRYKVTAVRQIVTGIEESPASGIGETKGNLFLNNATCTISWSSSPGAERYRVYKNYKGLYCYIGETEETTFTDTNYDPDESITPPIYDDPFLTEKAIREVSVANGGSGYRDSDGSILEREIDVSKWKIQWATWVDYPPPPPASLPKIEVYDRQGSGRSATATITDYTYETMGYTDSSVRAGQGTITKIKITAGGKGYVDPYIRFYFKDGKSQIGIADAPGVEKKEDRYGRIDWVAIPVDVGPAGAELIVSDSTGWGADLRAEVSGGRITRVHIRSGGHNYTNPQVTVKASFGSGASVKATTGQHGDYPGAVCYYEQRRCFAGTPLRPQMVWMTRSGTESDMSYTMPSKDDNRLRFAIAAKEASRILHLLPLQQVLALTNSTEYRISSGGSAPMAPDAIRSEVQAQIGASTVQPIIVNSVIVYPAARGGHVRELGYSWQSNAFTTGDLSIRSAHFFERARVVDMTLAKSPDPVVWCAMSDGSLLGLTYLPEQAIGGWHRHTTIGGVIESVTAVPEGDEDILYLVVRREMKSGTVRFIERMHERLAKSLADEWHVDCGGVYDGPLTPEVSGLTWLEGKDVSILADGCVLPSQVVKDGKVSLTQPSGHVIVGLPIVGELQTLPVAIQLNDGSGGMGHAKNVNDVVIRVDSSSGIFVGPDFDKLVEYKQRTTEPYGSPPRQVTKEISVATIAKWSDTGQVCIQQSDPLPLTVVSLAWELAR